MKRFFFLSWLVTSIAFAVDLPGGLIRTGANPLHNYEMILSPSFDIAPGGAYLSSEFRAQLNDDIGMGLGFGAGEMGFNFGASGVWYISPDLPSQPAFAVVGGFYFNRLAPYDYLLVKASPIVSKSFKTDWGSVSPYGGGTLTPSIGLGSATGDFAVKLSTGVQFTIKSLSGVQLWTEFDLGLFHSNHEVVIGMSYPFAVAGG